MSKLKSWSFGSRSIQAISIPEDSLGLVDLNSTEGQPPLRSAPLIADLPFFACAFSTTSETRTRRRYKAVQTPPHQRQDRLSHPWSTAACCPLVFFEWQYVR